MKHSRQLSALATAAFASLVNGVPIESSDEEKHHFIQLKLTPGQVATIDESQDIPIISFAESKAESKVEGKKQNDVSNCKSYILDMTSVLDDVDKIDIPTTTYDPYDEQYYPSQMYGSTEGEEVLPPIIAADAFQKPQESLVLKVFAPNAGWQAPLIPIGSFSDMLHPTIQSLADSASSKTLNLEPDSSHAQAVVPAESKANAVPHSHTEDTKRRAAKIFGLALDTGSGGIESATLLKRKTTDLAKSTEDGETLLLKQDEAQEIALKAPKRESKKDTLKKRRLLSETDSDHCLPGSIYSIIDDTCQSTGIDVVPLLDENTNLDTFTYQGLDGTDIQEGSSAFKDDDKCLTKLAQLNDHYMTSSSPGSILIAPLQHSIASKKGDLIRRSQDDETQVYGPQIRLEKRMKHGSNAFNASIIGNGAGRDTHGHIIHDNTNGALSSPASSPIMYGFTMLAALVGIWVTSL